MDAKQVIIIPRSLKDSNGNPVGAGKIGAQVAHAAVANVLNLTDTVTIKDGMIYRTISYPVDSPEADWIDNSFTKVLLGVDTEAEMLAIYEKAKLAGLNVSLIEDEGRTVFNGVTTKTCIGIGPHVREAFTGLTDHLKRY